MEQPVAGSGQTGAASVPMQKPTQVPMLVSPSTAQHIEPMSQLSMPLTPLPSTVQVSPTASGAASSGLHRVAFHELPPALSHGMHFSPFGQSCAQTSHSLLTPPPSGSMMNTPAVALAVASVVVVSSDAVVIEPIEGSLEVPVSLADGSVSVSVSSVVLLCVVEGDVAEVSSFFGAPQAARASTRVVEAKREPVWAMESVRMDRTVGRSARGRQPNPTSLG